VDDPRALGDLDLPDAYVVKPTHGSGAVLVVSPAAPADARLPAPAASWAYRHVRPEHADRALLIRIAQHWRTQLYGQGPNREWAYGHVPRRVIVEELLRGERGAIPDDYKLFVFHQECRAIQVDGGRFGDRTQDFFSPEWDHLELSGGPAWSPTPIEKPALLAEMLDIASVLAADTDFLRVDLYVVDGRIVVGELTSYPAGGDSPFFPESYNSVFGAWWTVPRRYG
jgi:hypothetical protein